MSPEAREFLEALREYLEPLSAPAGVAIGYIAGKRRSDAVSRRIEVEGDATALEAVRRSFEALIEGYEQRVAEQSREIAKLREEVWALRKALDEKQKT